MRTLTRERVDSPGLFNGSGALSFDLIGDGPSDVLAQRLNDIHQRTDFAQLVKSFSKNFEVQLANMEGIDKKEVSGLISGLDKTAIKLLEKRVTSRCRIWAWIERTIWAVPLSIVFGALFNFFGESAFYSVLLLCLFFLGMPVIFPMVCLLGFANDDDILAGSMKYIKDRKRLIRIYGREYISKVFPR